MEIKLSPIAPKKEIQKFISNIKTFHAQSKNYYIEKDIFTPIHYTVSIYSVPKDQNDQDPPIKKFKTIQTLTSFFNQSQNPIGEEISLNNIDGLINLISSGPFGLKIRFSVHVRSLSLLIKYLLTKEFPAYDRINKNLTQKTIDDIISLPVRTLFYPEIFQHPLFDFEILNYQISSPTSICASNDNIFACSKDGLITKYLKGRFTSINRGVYKIPNNFGTCSVICLNNKLYFINTNQKCIIIDTEELTISTIFSTVLSYPCISDGYYIYSLLFDKKIRVRIFNNKFEKVRNTIKLNVPDTISLSINMPLSTNGSFINFIDNDKCHIFSILTGRYIGSQKIQISLQSITYDFQYCGFVCLSENGLVEIPARSTIPPWSLNYQMKKIDNIGNINVSSNDYGEKNCLKDCIFEALGLLAIQYVGGGNDIPLSMFDDNCISSLDSLLSYLLVSKEGHLNENAIISVLGIMQVKIRRFSQLPPEFDKKLIQFFTEERLTFARRSASFLFLSCLSLFEKQWSLTSTNLLKLIVDDKNCSDYVFSFLTLFSFNVDYLEESFLQSILNLMVNSDINQRFKAVNVLSMIQEKLINKLPATESLFTSYVTNLMIKVTENWTSYLSTGNDQILSSTCFAIARNLEMQIMKNLDRINLPLIVTERFFAVSIMQQMGNDNDEQFLKIQQIFNCLLFFALLFAFKGIETNHFVSCSQKVDCNHAEISIDDFKSIANDNTQEMELLIRCANESNWSSKSEVENFLNETKQIVEIDELEKRIEKLHSIQPQPLRKIQHFLISGEFNLIKHQDSAIFQLMNYAQWIPSSFNRLIFAFFLNKIEEFQDDFLCIPRSNLLPFVQSCPVTLLLPLSIIKFSQVKLKESSMDFYDMKCSYDKISMCIAKEQSDEFIQPLLNLKTNAIANKRNVYKALISAVIGFRKSEINEVNDEIIQKIVYCRKTVSSLKMVKLLLEIIKIFALKGDQRIFYFIIEVIGSCVLKKSDVFPNAKNSREVFQFAFEFVEFARDLLQKSDDFRSFLASSKVLGNASEDKNKNLQSELNENDINVIKKTAFLTIVNNIFSYPVVGATFSVVDHKMEQIESKITQISKNGHKITLENGSTYDIRNIYQYNVTSPHKINGEIFDDGQITKIVDFFNKFYKYFKFSKTAIEMKINNSELSLRLRPLIGILYFTSLQCLSSNRKFLIKFNGIYSLSTSIASSSDSLILPESPTVSSSEIIEDDELFFIEPINDKTVFRRFWEFYIQPSTPDFTVFHELKNEFYTSPITPTCHFSVRFHFLSTCEATLYCCFPASRSKCEMKEGNFGCKVESYVFHEMHEQALVYQTVTFCEYFDFVLDADSQQVSMISHDKTLTFPIYNSALFYSIFMKVKNVTFEIRNEKWPLDKLNSFDSFDFSTFNLCRFNNMIIRPCKSFEDSFLNELGIVIRNMCLKSIIPNMLKVKPIETLLCVSYVNVMLSNFEELFKNSPSKLKRRIKNNIEIYSNFDVLKMTEIFISYVKRFLTENAFSAKGIWRNNSYAKPAKKGTIVCNCVIFAPGIIKVANEKYEVDSDCFIIPKDHLNRTSIEMLMFSKNALIFCKETHNDQAFNEIAEIMRNCQKQNICGFTETDLKSVDTIINEVEELCGS